MCYTKKDKTMKKLTSIRLTPEAVILIRILSKKMGVNQTAILELAIRELARKENVEKR